jgi:hypothetical protein
MIKKIIFNLFITSETNNIDDLNKKVLDFDENYAVICNSFNL